MKKYLITGGAGFIGSNIVKKILGQGDFVRVVDNLSTGRKENIEEFLDNPKFDFIEGDLTDLNVAELAVGGVDFILHQAAIPSVPRSIEDPLKSNNANITATLNLLITAKKYGVKKIVYASSSSIYGNNPMSPKKEDFPINPLSPYALTKYTGERYCQLFWDIYKLPTICLRYFNVFGPKQNPNSQYSAVIPSFIKSVLADKRPTIFGTGEQSRDFTYVDNVIEANLLAIKSVQGFGEVFNIACNEETSLKELLNLIQEIIGTKVEPHYTQPRKGDVLHSRADISKAQNILGYKPVVNLKEGLIKTVDWYKQND